MFDFCQVLIIINTDYDLLININQFKNFKLGWQGMTRQSISIDDDVLEVLKKKAVQNSRSLSKEIEYRLKLTLRSEEEQVEKNTESYQ